MAHRVSEIHINHLPSMTLELVDNDPMEVLVVHGIIAAEDGGIIIIYDRFVRVRSVVSTEVGNKRRDFALELDIKRFNLFPRG